MGDIRSYLAASLERPIGFDQQGEGKITATIGDTRIRGNTRGRRQGKRFLAGRTTDTNDLYFEGYRLFKTDVADGTEILAVLFLKREEVLQRGQVAS